MNLNDLIWKVKSAVLARGGSEGEDFDHTVALHADEAIRECVRRCAPTDLWPYLVTDPDETTATVDADGVADLAALTEDPRVLLDLLCYGDITHADYARPFRLLEQEGFAGSMDALYPKCWLEGKKLYTRVGGENPLSGDLLFRVPHWMTLADFPAELVEVKGVGLVDVLIEMAGLMPKPEPKKRTKES